MVILNHKPIYLDHQATTPLEARVWSVMEPYWREHFGNPSSGHAYGWVAAAAIDQARSQVAAAIGAEPAEIIFTSGATEANNLILRGVAEAAWEKGRHMVTVATEHRAILEPCAYLEKLGFEVTYLSVDSEGLIDVDEFVNALRPDTILVSVMAANNEIGVLQPVSAIGAICRQRQIVFHTDATQALGKVAVDVQRDHIDALSLSAHKVYGPKGIGALYLRRSVRCIPQQLGGGQEQQRRGGTLATPLIVGWGAAAELAVATQASYISEVAALRDRLWQQLQDLPGVYLNGSSQQRLPDNLHLSFEGISTANLLQELQPVVALGTGSACSQGRPSHVLAALGRDARWASLRFSLGRETTVAEIDRVAQGTIAAVKFLRS